MEQAMIRCLVEHAYVDTSMQFALVAEKRNRDIGGRHRRFLAPTSTPDS